MPALPDAIAGVRFRYYRDEADFAKLLTIYNAARLADGISGIETLAGITNNYRHLTNCDLDRDLIIGETADGNAVAYGRVTWWVEEATQLRSLLAIVFVHPQARSRGGGGPNANPPLPPRGRTASSPWPRSPGFSPSRSRICPSPKVWPCVPPPGT